VLDSILHGSPRISCPRHFFVPGQQECDSFGKEWKGFEWQAYKAHQYSGTSLLPIMSKRKGDISLVWCLTGDMIGDFMTKPLQGALFQKFRDKIMGVVPAQDPGPGKAKTKIDELNTHTDKPTKGKELKPSIGKSTIYNLVPSKEKGWHHRSVLREVTCMKDGCLKNFTRTS
jgi:hypothetical protein